MHTCTCPPPPPQAAAALPAARGSAFDWEGDTPLNLPMESLVIYEAHVRGFTAHASCGVAAPGVRQAEGVGRGGERGLGCGGWVGARVQVEAR